MRHITKNNIPNELVRYSKGKDANYHDLIDKHNDIYKKIRESLLKEQGYICCYCGCKIDEKNVHIEHIKCQHYYQNSALDYNNMLACCDGGSLNKDGKVRTKQQHCDKSKGDRDIEINPLQENCEKKFIYYKDGTVKGKNDAACRTINILNLNSTILVNRRKAYLANYNFPIFSETWDEEIEYLKKRTGDKYMEFNFAIISYITNNFLNSSTNGSNI